MCSVLQRISILDGRIVMLTIWRSNNYLHGGANCKHVPASVLIGRIIFLVFIDGHREIVRQTTRNIGDYVYMLTIFFHPYLFPTTDNFNQKKKNFKNARHASIFSYPSHNSPVATRDKFKNNVYCRENIKPLSFTKKTF